MTDDPLPGVVIGDIGPNWAQALERFFLDLEMSGDDHWFHPFPLDGESATRIAEASGTDRYLIATEGDRVLALGMLRGWDDGYEIPSLGIAVRSAARGTGLGRRMMTALHEEARRHGATRVRLTVDRDNSPAIDLYASMGYLFEDGPDDRRIGWFEL